MVILDILIALLIVSVEYKIMLKGETVKGLMERLVSKK